MVARLGTLVRGASAPWRRGSRLLSVSNSAQRSIGSWATVDAEGMSGAAPARLSNLVDGEWRGTAAYASIPDPLNGEPFILMPDTSVEEAGAFVTSLRKVPKSGLHNPLKRPERYNLYGEVSFRAAAALAEPETEEYFIRLIKRTMPKHRAQALAEVAVSRTFLKNFSGDSVRFMAQGFAVSGDHAGQESKGYRWPYGPVALVAPFNFPLEIPVLQLMGALYMGNKPLLKGSPQTSLVLEEFVRLLIHCGMPPSDVDLLHAYGEATQHVITQAPVRMTQFTGSSTVAARLLAATGGQVKVEDAGFDWKIVGADVDGSSPQVLDYVAWQCDQDAYAIAGQKCSAQSMLFAHASAVRAGLLERMEALAARRGLEDLSVGPVMSWTTAQMTAHVEALLRLPGARLLFGGEPLEGHSIPEVYGALQPTAVFVPLDAISASDESFALATTEVFGPVQVVTEYDDESLPEVLAACERISHHLTAAVVSNDAEFLQRVLGATVNGTTYAGLRARTTGAPANHWFGPGGNPNGAGIGTAEAIRLVWSCHREIVHDSVIPHSWTTPDKPT